MRAGVHFPTARPVAAGRFARHLGEMVVAMMVGMMVFGAFFGALLLAAGTTSSAVLESAPALVALVLMFDMTLPMVLWMRHRGHSRELTRDMTLAMAAVAGIAVVLLAASAIEGAAVCGVECALMIPAMVVAMLRHPQEY